MDDVHLENHVVVHEIRQSTLVCDDSAHFRSSQEHVFWLFLCEELLHLVLSGQIQLFVRPQHQIIISLTLKLANDGTSHHSAMTCNIYLTILFHYFLFV